MKRETSKDFEGLAAIAQRIGGNNGLDFSFKVKIDEIGKTVRISVKHSADPGRTADIIPASKY